MYFGITFSFPTVFLIHKCFAYNIHNAKRKFPSDN